MKVQVLKIDLSPSEVNRYMGYPCNAARTSRIDRRFEELWPEGLRLIEPRGTFRLLGPVEAMNMSFPEDVEHLLAGLCTIGEALERRVIDLSAGDDILGALILDAIGSAAAEATADALDRQMDTILEARGLYGSERVSPGYGGWPVCHQEQLLHHLDLTAIGVGLTALQMMIPRKSVSFAIPCTRVASRPRRRISRCERCSLLSCRFRRPNATCFPSQSSTGVGRR